MSYSDKQFQQEAKKIWKTASARMKVLGDEALEWARKGEKEMARAAKMGRIQIDVLSTKRQQDRVHQEIGRRIVELARKNKLDIPGIKSQVARSAALSRRIRSQQGALKRARRASRRRSKS